MVYFVQCGPVRPRIRLPERSQTSGSGDLLWIERYSYSMENQRRRGSLEERVKRIAECANKSNRHLFHTSTACEVATGEVKWVDNLRRRRVRRATVMDPSASLCVMSSVACWPLVRTKPKERAQSAHLPSPGASGIETEHPLQTFILKRFLGRAAFGAAATTSGDDDVAAF